VESFEKYAEYYDLLYRDKDYEKECDFVEEIFQNFSSQPIRTVLDGGCGTGGHAIPLARRGYKVTGIDSSAIMLKQAERKSRERGVELTVHQADLRCYDLGKKFDAATAMFAVINYLNTNEDIQAALATFRKHLNGGSLFIFDVWNGLAVMRQLPSERLKIVEDSDTRVIRFARPELQPDKHLCLTHYRILVVHERTIVDEIEETHSIRYLFPLEIAHYLNDADFQLLKICPFLDLKREIDENEWNMTVIAKAV
jgi:SAM-dependent methyltransferase